MKKIIMIAALFSAVIITGCATKNYGRQGELTGFEQQTMSCREIDLEMAKTQGFIDHVNKESAFSGKDVLAFLGDFGIGNSLEKTAALESADTRMKELRVIQSGKKCPAKI